MTAGGRSLGKLGVLLAVCALPHLVRLAGPKLALTDGFYTHGAWMMSEGFAPYTDFTQVAFPLAEGLLAAVFSVFGASLFAVELVHLVVVLAVAVALFVAGRRLVGPWTGALAAIGWSWSTWVVHFSLFERETWVALGTALALVAYFGSERVGWRRAALIASALLLAYVLKITAVMVAAGLCLHLALRGRIAESLRLGIAYSAGVLAVTALGWLAWGYPFLWQVYVFGFFRNQTHDVIAALTTVAAHADPTMLLGFAGLVFWGLPRLRQTGGALVCIAAMDLAYGTLVSPTIWDHNMINFVVTLSLLGGAFVDRVVSARRWGAAALVGVLFVTMILLSQGTRDEDGVPGWRPARYGLGLTEGRERAWLAEQASFVRAHSEPGDVVACVEPWVAFAAGRVKAVRYWDLQPIAMGVERSLAADGLLATYRKKGTELLLGPGRMEHDPRLDAWEAPYEKRLWANALHWVRPLLLAALAQREIALVLEPLPLGILTEDDLRAAGYERRAEHEAAGWVSADGVVNTVVRPIYDGR